GQVRRRRVDAGRFGAGRAAAGRGVPAAVRGGRRPQRGGGGRLLRGRAHAGAAGARRPPHRRTGDLARRPGTVVAADLQLPPLLRSRRRARRVVPHRDAAGGEAGAGGRGRVRPDVTGVAGGPAPAGTSLPRGRVGGLSAPRRLTGRANVVF